MSQLLNGPRYLMRWDHSCQQRLGRDLVTTTHRLGELPLFSERGLAAIIDSYPPDAMQVSTMGTRPEYPSEYQIGHVGKLGGKQLIEMIGRGRLSLRLCNVRRHHEQLGQIIQRLSRELIECQPGLRTTAHDGELEISSPTALTYFGIDVQPCVLWQVHGSRQIWVYPRETPFVDECQLQQRVTAGGGPMYFEPAFDDHARLYLQSSGEVLALPHLTPYRATAGDQMCVTLRATYETRQSRRRNDCHAANAYLRRFSPLPVGDVDAGWDACHIKRMILRWLGPRGNTCQPSQEPTFCVDPDCVDCVGPLVRNPDAETDQACILGGVIQTPTADYAVVQT